ncbi:MAG: hypothetical protein M1827_001878 [Pycnora praestabilis]|nr:MAG: hypothetical protein M1827_001878 [Pycnora praestabilis]
MLLAQNGNEKPTQPYTCDLTAVEGFGGTLQSGGDLQVHHLQVIVAVMFGGQTACSCLSFLPKRMMVGKALASGRSQTALLDAFPPGRAENEKAIETVLEHWVAFWNSAPVTTKVEDLHVPN